MILHNKYILIGLVSAALLASGCTPRHDATTNKPRAATAIERSKAKSSKVKAGDGATGDGDEAQQSAMFCGQAPQAPKRLISLAPSVTESLFALGLGAQVVGVTRYCDSPKQAKTIAKIGGFIDPNVEAVAALRPDLVIAVPNGQNRAALKRLCQLEVPVYVTYNYGLQQVQQGLLALGALLKVPQRAQKLVKKMRADLERLRKKLAQRPRVKLVMLFGHKPLVAAGRGTYAQSLIDIAGGQNLAARAQSRYPILSYETLLAMNPEQIIDAYAGGMSAGADQPGLDLQALSSLAAVKHHQVHQLHDAAALHPGPRAAKDAELIAKLIHPECF